MRRYTDGKSNYEAERAILTMSARYAYISQDLDGLYRLVSANGKSITLVTESGLVELAKSSSHFIDPLAVRYN